MRVLRGLFAVLLMAAGSAVAAEHGFGAVDAHDAQGNRFELAALDSAVDYAVGGLVAEARIRQRFVKQGRQYAPELVLAVRVIRLRGQRGRRGETAQYQRFDTGIENRWQAGEEARLLTHHTAPLTCPKSPSSGR